VAFNFIALPTLPMVFFSPFEVSFTCCGENVGRTGIKLQNEERKKFINVNKYTNME